MPNGDKMTHNEHFLPLTYLRGFSEDGKNIFWYDLNERTYSRIAVPISSVCYKSDLYETKDLAGEYLLPNFFEKLLGGFDDQFNQHYKALLSKAEMPENYECDNFLTQEERAFWVAYIAIQILRLEKTQRVIRECISKEFANGDQNIATATSLYLSFPVFMEMSEREKSLFHLVVEPCLSMSFGIGVIEGTEKLFASDNAVYILPGENARKRQDAFAEEYRKIIFPLSEKICLFMYGGAEKNKHKSNRLFPLSDEDLNEIYWSITYSADRKIYMSRRLESVVKSVVNQAHTARLSDMKKNRIE